LPATDAPPLIGIDASRMVGRIRTGTENYSYRIIRALLEDSAPWAWRLYFNGNASDANIGQLPNVDVADIPAPRLWTHLRLSRELLAHRPSGLFVPSHVIPLVHPKTVVTIHDLGYLHVPEAHPSGQRRMLDVTTRWSAAVARHIIVPSNQTRDDLVRFYRTPPGRISVVHHGVDARFTPTPDARDSAFRERYDLPNPFVLAVGTIQPRKNLPALAHAMLDVSLGHDLVIAGKRGWMADEVMRELQSVGLGTRLRLLDYVPDDDLPALYRHAEVVVQPSRFEGFGMPVLEAMASGTPVIAARGSSLTEIGGDAAVFFDYDDPDDLPAQIRAVIGDTMAYREISARSIRWAKTFSWERAARETRQVLQDTLLDGGR
jgi:glycosyltransferase involved in cell wall biosynthesis